MDLQLTPTLEAMSLEAKSNPFEMMNSMVKNHLKAFSKETSSQLRSTATKLLSLASITRNDIKLHGKIASNYINKQDYLTNASITLPIPMGLTLSYREYAEILSNAWVLSRDFAERSITQVDQYVSTLLAYPDKLGIVEENSMIQAIKFNTNDISLIKLKLEKAFDTKVNAETRPFGELFERNADFTSTIDTVAKLSNDYANRDNKKLNSQVNQLAEKSSLLFQRINNDQFNAKNKTASNIADVLHHTASEVEFYAAISQLIEDLLGRFDTAVKTISQMK